MRCSIPFDSIFNYASFIITLLFNKSGSLFILIDIWLSVVPLIRNQFLRAGKAHLVGSWDACLGGRRLKCARFFFVSFFSSNGKK